SFTVLRLVVMPRLNRRDCPSVPTRRSADLDVSQPTLSQALAALANGLGLQLIERSTRRVLVTEAGRRLLPQAIATLDAADRFLRSEEHTSELQSRENLVCRLLLAKNKRAHK